MAELSLEQKRAQSALDLVNLLKNDKDKRSYLEALPASLMVNGIVTVLLRCKVDKEHAIGEGISAWIRERFELADGPIEAQLLGADAATYRQITLESLRYAEWLKRWAQAYIEKPGKQGKGEKA